MRVAINGFGRIGRHTLRNLVTKNLKDIQVVAINDLTHPSTLAHLLKYDSVHGPFPGEISSDDTYIYVNGVAIKIFCERSPLDLPWESLDIDIVIESTGLFTTKEKAQMHLKAGAKQVIISDPS